MTRDRGTQHRPAPGAPRRRRTRWLMVVPLLGLALIVAGVVALEAVHPQAEPSAELAVDDIEPLAIEDDVSCIRLADGDVDEDLRRSVPTGGRLSSEQVYGCPSAFDGLEVSFVGEAVGDVLRRRGGAWVQVNDDAYALLVGPVVGHREHEGFNSGLSVWLPDGLHERIETVGRPGVRGDVIDVRGILHQSDPDDGGGITLRAESLEVVADSVEVEPPFHALQAVVAAVLAVAALVATLWARRVRRR
jgi:hypothetical protein